jgi:hypothetical protein
MPKSKKPKKVKDYCGEYAKEFTDFKHNFLKYNKHEIQRLHDEQELLAMEYAFNKFLLSDDGQKPDHSGPRDDVTMLDFQNWCKKAYPTWKYDSVLRNLKFTDYEGEYNEFRLESFVRDALWFLKNTTLFVSKALWYPKYPTVMCGNDGDLVYTAFCPHCGTLIVTHHDDPACNQPLICPTCAGDNFVGKYQWKYYKPGDDGYDDVRRYVNWSIDWDKKYYFKIGKPDKILRIGKWTPHISVKNDGYVGGKKQYYIHLGFYPYRVWLAIKQSPHSVPYRLEAIFMPKRHERKYQEWKKRMEERRDESSRS